MSQIYRKLFYHGSYSDVPQIPALQRAPYFIPENHHIPHTCRGLPL